MDSSKSQDHQAPDNVMVWLLEAVEPSINARQEGRSHERLGRRAVAGNPTRKFRGDVKMQTTADLSGTLFAMMVHDVLIAGYVKLASWVPTQQLARSGCCEAHVRFVCELYSVLQTT